MDAIQLTADLKRHRDDMRRILGERYTETIQPYREVLRGAVNQTGLPIAQVALRIAADMDAQGIDPSCVFAAFVDEVNARGSRTNRAAVRVTLPPGKAPGTSWACLIRRQRARFGRRGRRK